MAGLADFIAQTIRVVDGNNTMSAGTLAEHIAHSLGLTQVAERAHIDGPWVGHPLEGKPIAVAEPWTWGELRELCEGLPDSAVVDVIKPDSNHEMNNEWSAVPFDMSLHGNALIIELEEA